jgi:hypothetical protein
MRSSRVTRPAPLDPPSWDRGKEVAQTGLFRKRNKLTVHTRGVA